MPTLLDCPKIMQIYCIIKYPKVNFLELQFLLPQSSKDACNIQKTIIFANTISDIKSTIMIIQAWMKQLGYPDSCITWI